MDAIKSFVNNGGEKNMEYIKPEIESISCSELQDKIDLHGSSICSCGFCYPAHSCPVPGSYKECDYGIA